MPAYPVLASSTPAIPAPSAPPDWLLKPIRPTPVALDSPEYSVLAATRIGNVVLSKPVLTVARATVGQRPRSRPNSKNPQTPPAAVATAIKTVRYRRFATKPAP